MTEQNIEQKNIFLKTTIVIISLCFVVISICFASLAIQSVNNNPENIIKPKKVVTIQVSGEGEAALIPDIANIKIVIRDINLDVASAQKIIDQKARKLSEKLEKIGISEKDILSLNYQSIPKRESVEIECAKEHCPTKYQIVGYNVSQSIKIKIDKIDLTGEVLTAIGEIGISEISGPNFEVLNDEKFKSEARTMAIRNSKDKALEIAQALEMKLGKVAGFHEMNNAPHYRSSRSMSEMKTFSSADSAPAKLFSGEDVVKSRVTVNYYLEEN
ncbi:MAG: hypothetical protein ACI9TO_000368 [Rickettsiales bacterium]|jgi:uncharacterized protein YggE